MMTTISLHTVGSQSPQLIPVEISNAINAIDSIWFKAHDYLVPNGILESMVGIATTACMGHLLAQTFMLER